jgi:uncharacterized membrane protein YkgB
MGDFFQFLANSVARFFSYLFGFLSPVVLVISSLTGLVSLILGALNDPEGWVNQTICFIIDFVSSAFPSTPSNLKISSLIQSVPLLNSIGFRFISDTFLLISGLAAIALVVKIYKLIPFKAT